MKASLITASLSRYVIGLLKLWLLMERHVPRLEGKGSRTLFGIFNDTIVEDVCDRIDHSAPKCRTGAHNKW